MISLLLKGDCSPLQLDMARRGIYFLSLVLLWFLLSYALGQKRHRKINYREKIKEKMEELNEQREVKREENKGVVGWRRKRNVQGGTFVRKCSVSICFIPSWNGWARY